MLSWRKIKYDVPNALEYESSKILTIAKQALLDHKTDIIENYFHI